MTVVAWLWIALSLLGAITFSALVWFAGPIISVGDAQPFDGVFDVYRQRRRQHRHAIAERGPAVVGPHRDGHHGDQGPVGQIAGTGGEDVARHP